MYNRYTIIVGIFSVLLLASCVRNSESPGREFIPDMGRPVAYEGYFENPGAPILKHGMNAQLPAEGSVAQSFEVYPFPNSVVGYNAAGDEYFNEFTFTDEEISGEGKRLFDIYCAICHGEAGDGKGHLVNIDKYPPPPSYFRDDILALPEGKRYHSIMFGKGMMGSYASQINHKERWLVLSYVESMQKDFIAKQETALVEEKEL